jgi:hypothetical protein
MTLLLLVLSLGLFEGTMLPELPQRWCSPGPAARDCPARTDLLRGRVPDPPRAFTDSDLVVGYPDTVETRVITGDYRHTGRVIVVNRGTLLLDHARFQLEGDITVCDFGRLVVQGGTFSVVQRYAYQYNAAVFNGAEIDFESTLVSYNGQSWGNGLTDSARFRVRDSRLTNGFTTLSVTARSRVDYERNDFASEFVICDSSQVNLANCDTALLWFTLPNGSELYYGFPNAETTITHWEFHDSIPAIMGFGYRVRLDTVQGVMWGLFPRFGSVAVVRDSRLRACGVIFDRSDSVGLSGFANNRHYGDELIPLPDRNLRLVNVDLGAWNFYPYCRTRFVVESSVFGELLASDSTRVTMQNCICDGSGGYVGMSGNSQTFVISSTVNTQFISRGRSLAFAGLSNVNCWPPEATDASIMLLILSPTEYEPIARETASVFISDLRIPGEAQCGSFIPITGTADIRSGPVSPVRFASYQMFWCRPDSPASWHDIGPIHTQPVIRDTLDLWDTRSLEPGAYVLKMKLKDTLGDSIEPTRGVYLQPAGIAEVQGRLPTILSATPNPAIAGTHIRWNGALSQPVPIAIFDLLGRQVRALTCAPLSSEVTWDRRDEQGSPVGPGIYFVRLYTSEHGPASPPLKLVLR